MLQVTMATCLGGIAWYGCLGEIKGDCRAVYGYMGIAGWGSMFEQGRIRGESLSLIAYHLSVGLGVPSFAIYSRRSILKTLQEAVMLFFPALNC